MHIPIKQVKLSTQMSEAVSEIGSSIKRSDQWSTLLIDVGMNRLPIDKDGKSKLCGDVDYDEVKQIAGAITPVPGGVGPMTIACLLKNTVTAACEQNNLEIPKI